MLYMYNNGCLSQCHFNITCEKFISLKEVVYDRFDLKMFSRVKNAFMTL